MRGLIRQKSERESGRNEANIPGRYCVSIWADAELPNSGGLDIPSLFINCYYFYNRDFWVGNNL